MSEQQRVVRIVGDGTPEGTFVEDILSGERLAGVERVEFAVAVGQAPIKARITLSGVVADIITPAIAVLPVEVRDEEKS